MSKIKIHIITNSSCPNSIAFNTPLIAAKKIFEGRDVQLRFFIDFKKHIFNSDVLFINSNVFRSSWDLNKNGIFSFLEKAGKAKQKIIWFDTTDSTWCTQFEVLPHVDKFLKGQIFADKSRYLTPFKTGRIFTDAFDKLYNCNERNVAFPAPDREDLKKIGISWNTCFENYSERRYDLKNRIIRKIKEPFLNHLSTPFHVKFTPFKNSRSREISCRIGLSHSRKSIVSHRKAIIEILKKRGVSTGKISLPEYFTELRNSQIGVGPFGMGEITLRDFEIIICGAVLFKPDMSHMQTWPELFIPDRTYVAHKWDLSDFDEKIEYLLNNQDKCRELADNAKEIYQKSLSEKGKEEFAERLICMF